MIDNGIYERLGEFWWDEDCPLNVLHGSFTPGRFGYFRGVLDRLGCGGARALDVGCGGGFLAEEFARRGCTVVGIDPSAMSIGTARRHAGASGLAIEYVVATGERLPLADGSFDLAYCCDVLEHVPDPGLLIAETARVLKPGGVYLFDTINRTIRSKLLAIKVIQEWRPTRITDARVHSWSMFIKPAELEATLRRHGLHLEEITGLGPRAGKAAMLWSYLQTRRGRMTYGQLSRRLDVGEIRNTAISYLGYATKHLG